LLALGWQRRGEKKPAVRVAQVREVVTPLRQRRPPGPREIAATVTRVLRGNEEARIDHGPRATGSFPPRRRPPDSS
jgi:hypothetical protein